ncbi:hypothetical protein HIM_01557 [Hirsutella minnesotensis 3608]|nr:hypothetical protein HIM_01557 [Hirsutella minnesotensis 3608]
MSNLLFLIFAVEFVAHLVSAIGTTRINNALWTLINFLPIATSKAAGEQRKLQSEYLKIRRDLNATSSQDEFAKWAKLRRQHDKLLEQLDASKKGQEGARAKFDNYLTVIRILLTKVPQYFVPFWYGKVPMFWLPYGWFPYYAEWIISFPSAPMGSVSAPSWQLACSGVIKLVSELILLAASPIVQQMTASATASTPQKASAKKAMPVPAASAAEEKKEL